MGGVAGRVLLVVAGEGDGRYHVGHGDVAVADIFHRAAAPDIGFDAEAVFGIEERAVAHGDVADAAGGFAADA